MQGCLPSNSRINQVCATATHKSMQNKELSQQNACKRHLHIDVVSTLGKVAVQDCCQVPSTLILTATAQHLKQHTTACSVRFMP